MLMKVLEAINAVLFTTFPDIEISSTDIEEGFTRPSFFVELKMDTDTIGTWRESYEIPVQIYYFPSDEYKYRDEVYAITSKLKDVFRFKLQIQDTIMAAVEGFNAEIIDKVLSVQFSVSFTADLPQDETPYYMETFEYSEGISKPESEVD